MENFEAIETFESFERNIATLTDSYKLGHDPMYSDDTEHVYSYFESRYGAKYDKTTVIGLQVLILENLVGQVITTEKIDRAEKLAKRHFGSEHVFNRKRWDYIVNKHGGRLPVKIRSVAEGTQVPVSNIIMDVVNTDKNCKWLTNHLETLLCHVWAPSTVATLSRATKEMYKDFLEITCDEGANFPGLDFMLHDFGMRGTTSMESAGICGLGHLINFLGTDTVIAMEYIEHFYGGVERGLSVPATEHSIMTAKAFDGENEVVGHVLNRFPTGILSMVTDSYNHENCVRNIIGGTYRDIILARDGKTVIRPDSGDPVKVSLVTMEILCDKFGYSLNKKGFKVLNPKVGMIWGDGIDYDGIKKVLEAFVANGYSVENIVFGMGGGLLQKINRDTQRFAFKSSAQCRNGVWYDVYKDPTDGSKASKRGRLCLNKDSNGNFVTRRLEDCKGEDYLKTVFEDGKLVKFYDFNEVIENSEQ